jgi:NAD(P)-dependent dehydrogenase (short-subunit alcohol dehydrogenase family)
MRSVLITGTSTGIGQATAVVLASRGWRVFATMRNLAKRKLLEQALEEAGVQNGVEIEQLDVASGTSIQAATASILSRTGNKLDAVVHNAGVGVAGALEDVPESELRRVMETNFFGVLGWDSPQTRSIALQNGRLKDGPRPSPMSLSPLGSTSFSLSLVLIAPRSGKARHVFSRQVAHIMHGCSRCFVPVMHMPRAWRAIRRRWLS